jgi:hypothetical protein
VRTVPQRAGRRHDLVDLVDEHDAVLLLALVGWW